MRRHSNTTRGGGWHTDGFSRRLQGDDFDALDGALSSRKGSAAGDRRSHEDPYIPDAGFVAFTLIFASQDGLLAQVVEGRDDEANPASVIFRSTLYGAGTGLLLGGAYALINEGGDPSTSEVLRWGAAGGAVAGLMIGLVHLATRSEPEGSVSEVGMLQLEDGDVSFSVVDILSTHVRDAPPFPVRTVDFNLVRVAY